MSLSLTEMVVIAVVALLLYGGRVPELMRTLGQWMGKLRRAYDDLQREFRREVAKIEDDVNRASEPSPGGPVEPAPTYPGVDAPAAGPAAASPEAGPAVQAPGTEAPAPMSEGGSSPSPPTDASASPPSAPPDSGTKPPDEPTVPVD